MALQDFIVSFRQIFTRAPADPALIDPRSKRVFSYGEVEDLSSRLAKVLRPAVPPSGRVCFLLHNGPEIALAYLACMQLGVTAVPINPALHPEELAQTMRFAQPDLVITT
ncbi:MAG: acyl--CoA ligase, partial [Rickettsiales bacterium]|nr:acyl--CoA ligase [Rickettsiales bacterium]